MNRHKLTLAAAVSCALSLYMIGGESQQTALVPPVPLEGSAKPVGAKASTQADTQGKPKGKELAADQKVEAKAPKVAYMPQFPDRSDLFQSPKRQGQGRMKTNGQSEAIVELLGFVNVDGPRVALSIDGLVATIAAGDEKFGVKVLKIVPPTMVQPPSAVLEHGGQRWPASFDN